MQEFRYAILNGDNICERYDLRFQPLYNLPENFIPISADSDVRWRKYEDGIWSTELYELETNVQLTEFQKVQTDTKNNKDTIASLTYELMMGGVL